MVENATPLQEKKLHKYEEKLVDEVAEKINLQCE
jgi:hypothetical protein